MPKYAVLKLCSDFEATKVNKYAVMSKDSVPSTVYEQ